MPAAVVESAGAEPTLRTIELPTRRTGTSVVAVVAAPLNPLDLLIASGTFHSVRHEGPYVPGSECVGVVVESDTHPVGTTVYAECHASPTSPGPLASHVLVADEDLLALPEGTDPVLGAAVGNSGTAAFMPLVEVAGLQPGETVLVLGATGAVGQFAVQIAHARGAGRVVGVARDQAALDKLLNLGADAVVALDPEDGLEDLGARLAEAAGPVDVVLDGLFGGPLEAALRACGPRARVVNIGNVAGGEIALPAGLLRGRQLSVSGFAGLHTPLAQKAAALAWLWGALTTGHLHVPVRTFRLDQVASAWRVQATSPHAKCVILPGDGHRPGVPGDPNRTTDESEQ
ncbi:quinone oxidoreductase family protein [Knoellia sp. CPCC 206453]|uniref:quinone oxidoreductase family protein n=1 Tax=Knoellia pratensis TaxID=3404796 RepID=UPI003606F3BE